MLFCIVLLLEWVWRDTCRGNESLNPGFWEESEIIISSDLRNPWISINIRSFLCWLMESWEKKSKDGKEKVFRCEMLWKSSYCLPVDGMLLSILVYWLFSSGQNCIQEEEWSRSWKHGGKTREYSQVSKTVWNLPRKHKLRLQIKQERKRERKGADYRELEGNPKA